MIARAPALSDIFPRTPCGPPPRETPSTTRCWRGSLRPPRSSGTTRLRSTRQAWNSTSGRACPQPCYASPTAPATAASRPRPALHPPAMAPAAPTTLAGQGRGGEATVRGAVGERVCGGGGGLSRGQFAAGPPQRSSPAAATPARPLARTQLARPLARTTLLVRARAGRGGGGRPKWLQALGARGLGAHARHGGGGRYAPTEGLEAVLERLAANRFGRQGRGGWR